MKKVLLLTNLPAPYMIDYLNELQKKCSLTVLFERTFASDRKKEWITKAKAYTFEYRVLKSLKIGKENGLSFQMIRYLADKKYDSIIIANPTTPTGVISLLYCRYHKIPFYIQSEGGFQGTGKGVKERFKKYIMEKAQLFLSGMKADSSNYFLPYGGSINKIIEYPFTSFKKSDFYTINNLKQKGKLYARELTEIKEKKVIITVGRFSYKKGYGKGYDILMRISEKLDSNIGVYIIGDEPTKKFIKWKEKKKLSNVHFISYLSKEELAYYYSSADLFVLFTRGDTWGLVINEAMAYSLPIVTTTSCVAGNTLIKNDYNGYIHNVEEEEQLYESVRELIDNNEKSILFGKRSYDIITDYTIENMASKIYDAIKEEKNI